MSTKTERKVAILKRWLERNIFTCNEGIFKKKTREYNAAKVKLYTEERVEENLKLSKPSHGESLGDPLPINSIPE